MSDALRRDHPWSARNWVLFFGGDWHWRMWNEAKHSFMTGESAARAATGHDFFEYVNDPANGLSTVAIIRSPAVNRGPSR